LKGKFRDYSKDNNPLSNMAKTGFVIPSTYKITNNDLSSCEEDSLMSDEEGNKIHTNRRGTT